MSIADNVNFIIRELCEQNKIAQDNGYGPFCAAICNENGDILTVAHNSVILENSSVCHAEINAIKQIQNQFNTYDLSKHNLSICITAEPCVMCIGAIMWSGIKNVYYGLPSKDVEEVSGFIEGYKPEWQEYFKKIGINVVGGIEKEECKKALEYYVNSKKTIYKPSRMD